MAIQQLKGIPEENYQEKEVLQNVMKQLTWRLIKFMQQKLYQKTHLLKIEHARRFISYLVIVKLVNIRNKNS